MKIQKMTKLLSIIMALILVCMASLFIPLDVQAAEHSTTLSAPETANEFANEDYFSLYAVNPNGGCWVVQAPSEGISPGSIGNYIRLSWDSNDITVTKIIVHVKAKNFDNLQNLKIKMNDADVGMITIDEANSMISITDIQTTQYFIYADYINNLKYYDIDYVKVVYTLNSEGSETDPSSPNQSTEQVTKDESSAEEKANNDVAEKAYEALATKEENIPIEALAASSKAVSLPSEVKNMTEKGEAVYDLSSLQTTSGIVKAIENLNTNSSLAATTASTKQVTIYTNSPIAFNAQIVNEVSQLNSDFVYMFKYKGVLYRIKIPARTKMDLKGANFQGPLFFGANYGTVEIMK